MKKKRKNNNKYVIFVVEKIYLLVLNCTEKCTHVRSYIQIHTCGRTWTNKYEHVLFTHTVYSFWEKRWLNGTVSDCNEAVPGLNTSQVRIRFLTVKSVNT
jgi:hypothetical protein